MDKFSNLFLNWRWSSKQTEFVSARSPVSTFSANVTDSANVQPLENLINLPSRDNHTSNRPNRVDQAMRPAVNVPQYQTKKIPSVKELLMDNLFFNDDGVPTIDKKHVIHQTETAVRSSSHLPDNACDNKDNQGDFDPTAATASAKRRQQSKKNPNFSSSHLPDDACDDKENQGKIDFTADKDRRQSKKKPNMQQPRQGMTSGQRFSGGSQPRRPGGAMAGGQPPQFAAGRNPNAVSGGRRKRRLADRVISLEILELVPEAEAYMSLVAFEQKLDASLARKKLDYQEALKRPIKIKKKLRIFVSHSFTAGKEPEREGDEGSVPMWELRVEGRLLDEPPTAGANGAAAAAATAASRTAAVNLPKRKFSSFFKSLVIELDKDIYGPDNHLVEWHRTPTTNETDGFQVKRPGDRDVKCTILLLLDHQPMKYKLHPRLAKMLGIAVDTRPKIIEALWQYIKTHNLQGESDRDSIICDEFLEPLFGCKRMRFMEIPQRLGALLQQPDPLIIEHTIKYDGQDKNTICYDIEVELDDPVKLQMPNFLHNHTNMPEIAVLDQKISELIEQINEFKVRRDFYAGFADNPLEFTQNWLISQSKDIKTIAELNSDFEAERRADYYYQPHIQEGVFRYIYGKVQQKRLELESTLGVRHN